jgi:glycine oxidase
VPRAGTTQISKLKPGDRQLITFSASYQQFSRMRSRTESLRPAEVAVVGGGVVGLSVARALALRGLSTAIVEGQGPGAGASGAAGGMLAPQAEADYRDEMFELLCASRRLYPPYAERLYAESGIDVELDRTGTLYAAFTEHDEEEVGRRYSWQRRAGLAVERLTAEEARSLEPNLSPRVRGALLFPEDWQVENRQLVRALAASCLRLGVRIHTQTEACGLRLQGERVTGVETSRGCLSAAAIVLAAGAWAARVPLVATEAEQEKTVAALLRHPEIEPVRGQMLCFEQAAATAPIRHVLYSPRGYLVPRRDGRLLAGSTTEHVGFDCAVTAGGLNAVTSHALELAPLVADLRLQDTWAGLRPRAIDGLPVLGESEAVRGLFYAAGLYRNGILLAPAVGELMAGLVTGDEPAEIPSHLLPAFSPARFARALAFRS